MDKVRYSTVANTLNHARTESFNAGYWCAIETLNALSSVAPTPVDHEIITTLIEKKPVYRGE